MDWLLSAYKTIEAEGLCDKDKRPPDKQCERGHVMPYRWTKSGSYEYWRTDPCRLCQDEDRQKQAITLADTRLANALVPRRLATHRPFNLSVDEHNASVYRAVSEWRDPMWMLVMGPVGTGKTTWVTSLFNTLTANGGRWDGAQWMTEAELFLKCDVAHSERGYTARQRELMRIIGSPLLMLDDIGAGRGKLTEWQSASMRHLFDTRHAKELPTFMTTNIKSLDGFAERYGDHVASRISEASMGGHYMGGPDRRLPGR